MGGIKAMIARIAHWILLAVGLLALGTAGAAKSPLVPVSLWHGGTIITMDGNRPQTVQAVVVRGGKIVFAGSEARARKLAGPQAELHDLRGKTMLPGFIDAHSHISMAMQVASGIDLSDPAINTIPSIAAKLQQEVSARKIAPGNWVVGWQYSELGLPDKKHITRTELDAALPGYKVVLIHFTGHGLVASSAALDAAKITDATPTPAGGVTVRDERGRPSGVLFEMSAMPVYMALPQLTFEQKLAALDAAQKLYAAQGFTHAQDGGAQPADLAFLQRPEAKARLKLDLAVLAYHTNLPALLARSDVKFGAYDGHLKLQGIKFVLDGSPQARTAFFTKDYKLGSPEGHHPWHGQPNISEVEFIRQARQAHQRGWQLFVHGNGDAAIDMAIRGFAALGIKASDNRRPVVIHSQFQRPDQLAAYKRIGVGPAYFSNHTHYFADIHRSNFDAEVVDFISPFKSARAAGLIPSNHSDYPVTPLDTMAQLWSSMARSSLTGVVSGPDQRLGAYEGLQALTSGPAWQVFEENRKGRIKVGLLGDFVVLDSNPLTTPVDQIRSIRVMETIKEGRTVWKRP
jgi:predicted amidohydrolase YtcJ